METKNKEHFGGMAPNAVFLFGLITGIAVTFMFGSFSDSVLAKNNLEDTKKVVVVDDTNPTPTNAQDVTDVPPLTKNDHVLGDQNAQITLIEYSDFECPYCKQFHPTVNKLVEDYAGKVNVVYRHFPLSFHDPLASLAAEASECVADLGGNDAFWEFTDTYYTKTTSNGNGMTPDGIVQIAKDIGINTKKFQVCLDAGTFAQDVKDDLAGGAGAGIQGTPGSFLVGPDGSAQLISGAVPYSQLVDAVESLLAE